MKKIIAVMLCLVMVLAIAAKVDETKAETKVYNVAHLVNGNLGDKSFFDSASVNPKTGNVRSSPETTTKPCSPSV